MRLIIIGCEYAGKSTLARNLKAWMVENFGSCETSFHDHFVPWAPEAEGETGERMTRELLSMEPSMFECYQRYMIHYHTSDSFYHAHDHGVVNWYYADAVYAALYYGFGGPGQYAERRELARYYDNKVMELAPDTVLALVKASPDAIRQRRRRDATPALYPKDEDIEKVLARFEEEYAASLIRRKVTVDTTHQTSQQALADFIRQVEPHLSAADRLRMWTHRQLSGAA